MKRLATIFAGAFRRFGRGAFLGACLWCACAPWGFSAEDSSFVRFRFRVLSDQIISDLAYRNYPKGVDQGPEYTQMVSVGSTISADYDYYGPPVLEFYHSPVSPGDKPFFSFNIAGFAPGCVFVFWRESPTVEGQPGAWQCVPLNNFDRRFVKNKIAFFNFTKMQLAAKIGSKVYKPLPPFVEGLPVSDDFELNVLAWWEHNQQVVTVCRNTMMLKTGYRYLGIFFPSQRQIPGGKPVVSFKLISEIVDMKDASKYEPTQADIF